MTEEHTSELIKKAQNGDLRSFEQLAAEYQVKIFNIALGIMGNATDAEDAAQNALIKIYRAIGDFKFQSKFSTWVYRITTNVCMDELRKLKRTSYVSSEDLGDDALGTEDTEVQVLKSEAALKLREAISALKDEQRKVIVLRDINGFSYEEIAQITRSSVGTVKSRISRARANLKETLLATGYFDR